MCLLYKNQYTQSIYSKHSKESTHRQQKYLAHNLKDGERTMDEQLHNRSPDQNQPQLQRLNGFQLYDDYMNQHNDDYSSNDSASGSTSESDDATTELWVFGYGSLCWYPGFEYSKCVTGYVRGYVRRFWQGNTEHRGTKEKPGRVVTLVEQDDGITWGCAYKISGSTALNYLKQRECTLGGYTTLYTKFYPRVAADDMELCGEAFSALLYIATDKNDLWMGDTPLPIIAQEIADSRGKSGHNVEYLIRLANFMRDELKGVVVEDEHLFQLEQIVRNILAERNISVYNLMGRQPQRIRRDSHEEIRRPITFEFSSRVPDKKLRCLNI